MYMYVAGCYAAWNNNYSEQEEATLCIVKCLKEDRKLVFQMRIKVFNNNVIDETAEKHLNLYTGAIHP